MRDHQKNPVHSTWLPAILTAGTLVLIVGIFYWAREVKEEYRSQTANGSGLKK